MSVQEVPASLTGSDVRSGRVAADRRASRFETVAWIAVAAAAAFVLIPLLNEYRKQLWAAEHYRFFPLVLGGVAWLAWRRFQLGDLPTGAPRSWMRLALWSGAVLLTTGAALAFSPLGAAVALLALIVAGIYEWRAAPGLRLYLPVVAVLLLILRPPFGWDQKMIVAMQRSATTWASGILDLIGIRHLADGVVIRLPQRDFFVDEACSGVHSLFATLAFVAVYAVATRRGPLKSSLLLAASVFWVLVANSLRVLAIVVLSTRYGLPVVDGVGHETLGVLVFAFVIGLVLSTDRLLLFLFPPAESLIAAGVPTSARERHLLVDEPAGRRRTWFPATVAIVFVAIAAAVHLAPANATPRGGSPYASAEDLEPVPEQALPESWEGWQRVGFQVRERAKDDPAGEISRIWTYHKGRLTAAISIDGPFDAWHDTEVCYHGLGYTTQSCEDIPVADEGGPSAGFTELSVTSGSGQHGYVLFMAYATNGRPLHPPVSRNASVARLVSVWKQRVAGELPDGLQGERVFQVQLFTESGLNFTAAEREDLQRLFHHMRSDIARFSAPPKPTDAEGETT